MYCSLSFNVWQQGKRMYMIAKEYSNNYVLLWQQTIHLHADLNIKLNCSITTTIETNPDDYFHLIKYLLAVGRYVMQRVMSWVNAFLFLLPFSEVTCSNAVAVFVLFPEAFARTDFSLDIVLRYWWLMFCAESSLTDVFWSRGVSIEFWTARIKFSCVRKFHF